MQSVEIGIPMPERFELHPSRYVGGFPSAPRQWFPSPPALIHALAGNFVFLTGGVAPCCSPFF